MAHESPDFAKLFARRDILVRELLDVDKRLHLAAVKAGTEARSAKGKKGNGHASKNGNGATGKRRAWFERGEALKLMQSIATKPMHQADLVRAIAEKKTATKGLSAADAKKFQSATFQAIANAVAGKKLIAAKDGTVRARAGA